MLSSGAPRLLVRRLSSKVIRSNPRLLEGRLLPSRSAPTATKTTVRFLSSQEKDDEKAEESLKDTVRKMKKGDKNKSSDEDDEMNEKIDDFLRSAKGSWATFTEEVGKTWGELLNSGEGKSINKKIRHPEDTVEGEAEYTGSVEIMVIDESEHLTAWERMQRRLTEAPIISGKPMIFFLLFSSVFWVL